MKKIGKNILIVLFCLLPTLSMAKQGSEEDQFTQDIKYLFHINGSESSYKESIKAMIQQFKSMDSDVPTTYWDKAENEFLNTSLEDLMEMIVPIYRKNLSQEDVRAMIEFYESEAGKRIAKKMPKISTESMKVGMIWGQSIGKKIHDDIENKGYKIRLPFTP